MKRNKLSNPLPDRSRIALSREEMRELGYRVVDLLAEHFADVREERVGSKADPAKLIPLFADDPPELGPDPNELLAQLERDVLPNNLHVDHPRFFDMQIVWQDVAQNNLHVDHPRFFDM